MAESVSQEITDLLLRHDIDILRVLDGSETLIAGDVQAITAALIALLVGIDPSEPARRAFGQRRLDHVIVDSRAMIRDAYRDSYRGLRRDLVSLGLDEREAFRSITNRGFGTDLVSRSIDRSAITEILDDRAITANFDSAETLRGFFEREAAAHHRRVSGTLRQGFSQGDTLSQMVSRLRETNGVQARESVAIARTAYNHVTNNVRIQMMQRNAHLFRGVIAIAMLDGRTTPICISRSNGMWDLSTGNPLPGSPVRIQFPGPVPWHFAERTQLYPLTRSARSIGRQSESARRAIANLTPEQRRFLNADPPAQESYTEWLRRQPEAVQTNVLGRSRRELWLEGRLSLNDLVSQKGRPLTLGQLAKRRERAT